MSTENSEPRPWSRQRWWLFVALVFAAHLGLIFAFGDRKAIAPLPPAPTTALRLASPSDEFIALTDPTLFALPHRRSFSASAWLQIPEIPFQPYRWTEPPRLLRLPVEQLGETFTHFMQTNAFREFLFSAKPLPTPSMAKVAEPGPLLPTNSTFYLTGPLANRRWLNPPVLRAWLAADLLTNAVVQAVVRADGSVFSAKILPPGSGSADADKFALDAVQAARFTSERGGGDKLVVGMIVFDWVTVPLPVTSPKDDTP